MSNALGHIEALFVSILLSFILVPLLKADQISCDIRLASLSPNFIRPNFPAHDKTSVGEILARGDHLIYGAELTSPNPASAQTMAQSQSINTLFIDGNTTTSGQIYNLTNAVQNSSVVVVGMFTSPDDHYLKPKVDAGLHGAMLINPKNLNDTLFFLRQLYFLSPQAPYKSFKGTRAVGPLLSSRFLRNPVEMMKQANDMMIGAVSIGDKNSVANIDSIVKAKARGLRLIFVDSEGIALSLRVPEGSPTHLAALRRVEEAVKKAAIPMGTKVSDQVEAKLKFDRGYRQVIMTSDLESILQSLKRYEDIPLEPAKEVIGPLCNIKNLIRQNKMVNVGFLMTPDIEYAKLLASQTNALWIDEEHGSFAAPEEIIRIIKALPKDINIFVRTTWFNNPHFEEYISAGAKGIIAPSIENANEAKQFINRVKTVSQDALAIIIVETKTGLMNIKEITLVPGLDILYLDPYDLAQSLNVPIGSPPHQAAMRRIETAAVEAGIPLGGQAGSRSAVYEKRKKGYRFLTTISDQEAIAEQLKNFFGDIRQK